MGDTTGEHTADLIIDRLWANNIDQSNFRAQAYDGTGNMFQIHIFQHLSRILYFDIKDFPKDVIL